VVVNDILAYDGEKKTPPKYVSEGTVTSQNLLQS
jgi:hypothetical protein